MTHAARRVRCHKRCHKWSYLPCPRSIFASVASPTGYLPSCYQYVPVTINSESCAPRDTRTSVVKDCDPPALGVHMREDDPPPRPWKEPASSSPGDAAASAPDQSPGCRTDHRSACRQSRMTICPRVSSFWASSQHRRAGKSSREGILPVVLPTYWRAASDRPRPRRFRRGRSLRPPGGFAAPVFFAFCCSN